MKFTSWLEGLAGGTLAGNQLIELLLITHKSKGNNTERLKTMPAKVLREVC